MNKKALNHVNTDIFRKLHKRAVLRSGKQRTAFCFLHIEALQNAAGISYVVLACHAVGFKHHHGFSGLGRKQLRDFQKCQIVHHPPDTLAENGRGALQVTAGFGIALRQLADFTDAQQFRTGSVHKNPPRT